MNTDKSSEISPYLWVGIGLQKGSSCQLITKAIEKIFQENQLNENAIAGLATIDKKASESGLIELCCLRNFTLKTFSAEILSTVSVPNPTHIAANTMGTPSVAEASAILSASHLSPLEIKLLVPKSIFRLPGEPRAVTIAVAAIRQFSSKNN